MRVTAFLASLILTLELPALAFAGDGRAVVEHVFEMADTNEDGALTAAEYEAAGLERYGVTFEQTDADGDGSTSFDEYLDLYQAHHPPLGGCIEGGETV